MGTKVFAMPMLWGLSIDVVLSSSPLLCRFLGRLRHETVLALP